jgi:putative nucleotide binding protein
VESFAYVLDVLPNGRQTERGFFREPMALAIGRTELKLLELVLRPGAKAEAGQRIALVPMEGVAPPIDHVRRRLAFGELSATARSELPDALERIVLDDAPRYLRFFNEAPAVSRRFHLLELLPGIGKKTMQAIVEERKRAPFASFPELAERTHLKSPQQLVVARIEAELSGVEDKYRLFVGP